MGNFDLESGRRFLEEGDLVEAIRCLLASLDQDRSDPEAYVALFEAYARAWDESGDPLVLDEMRKVAIAGLKRKVTPSQRRVLEEGLERTEETIAAIQQAEEQAEQEVGRRESPGPRHLPVFRDGKSGGTGGGAGS